MEKGDTDNVCLYELSFHIVPTVSTDGASSEFEKITAAIEKAGGEIKSSQTPQEKMLSYEMDKEIAGKKTVYGSSFFGFVIFEVSKDSIGLINTALKENKNILRHLLINVPADILMPRERRIPSTHKEEVKRAPENTEAKVDESTIDKTIEELVIE